jgi:hypothetical protein
MSPRCQDRAPVRPVDFLQHRSQGRGKEKSSDDAVRTMWSVGGTWRPSHMSPYGHHR